MDRAQQAAIEKVNCRAFLLDCEHYTYIEDQLGWDVWRPKSKRGNRFYYCEKCHKWTHAMPKPKPAPMSETPLF